MVYVAVKTAQFKFALIQEDKKYVNNGNNLAPASFISNPLLSHPCCLSHCSCNLCVTFSERRKKKIHQMELSA